MILQLVLTEEISLFRYCRDLLKTGGTDATEPKIDIIQSNNVWEDANGSININSFVATFNLASDRTHDSDGLITVPFVSDNPFFTVDHNNAIVVPKFILRFKYDISVRIVSSGGTYVRKVSSYIYKSTGSLNGEAFITNESNVVYIKVPSSFFENKTMALTNSPIFTRVDLKSGDVLKKSEAYNATTITISGY